MKNLINAFICVLFLSAGNLYSKDINKILFSIENDHFTNIDLELRKKYLILMYKDINIDEQEVINDYISALLFDKHYQKKVRKKNLNKALEKYFKANFDYIYNLKSNNEIKKIFATVNKDEIYQNLKLDLQRKIIIENELKTKKDEIFKNDNLLFENIYELYIEYFQFFDQFENKEIIDFKDTELIKKKLDNEKISYKYVIKKVKNKKNLHKNIQDTIKNKKEIFEIIDNNKNLTIGRITKKIINNDNIFYDLVQIITKNKISDKLIKCNIEITDDKVNLTKITKKENVKYINLNKVVKEKLITINDYLIFKNDSGFVYLILCKISYDKDYYKQVKLNESIINISDDIERNFIKKKSIEYNLQDYYE